MPHLRQDHWRWYATGPDKGIQLTRGAYAGRLVIPCNHSDHSDPQTAPVPLARHLLGRPRPDLEAGRSGRRADQRIDDRRTGRRLDPGQHAFVPRATSPGGGDQPGRRPDLGTGHAGRTTDRTSVPGQHPAVFLARSGFAVGPQPDRILNPASTSRKQLTLRLSYDEGQTWAASRLLYGGSAAYSCLAKLPDGTHRSAVRTRRLPADLVCAAWMCRGWKMER